nr:thioesterase [Burkholderia anthina]
MRTNGWRSASATVGERAIRRRIAGRLRIVVAGIGVAFAMSGAVAAAPAEAGGIVRFTGALVDLYDVTLDASSVEAAGSATAVRLRFDAHGRRLPGAHVTFAGVDGRPLSRVAGAGIGATWRDEGDSRSVPLVSGRAHRVGPYGGVMTVAASETATGAVAPVVIRIRHP